MALDQYRTESSIDALQSWSSTAAPLQIQYVGKARADHHYSSPICIPLHHHLPSRAIRPFPKWQNPPRTPPEPCKRPRPSVHAPSSAATERGAPPVRPAVPPGLPAAFPAKERNARSPVPLPGAPPRNAARRTSAAPARAIRPRPRGYRERHTAPALRSATPPHVRSPGRAQHPSEELALLPETC